MTTTSRQSTLVKVYATALKAYADDLKRVAKLIHSDNVMAYWRAVDSVAASKDAVLLAARNAKIQGVRAFINIAAFRRSA